MGFHAAFGAASALLLVCSLAGEVRAAPSVIASRPVKASTNSETPSVPPHVALSIVGEVPDASALAQRMLSWFRGSASEVQSNQTKTLTASTILEPSAEVGVRVWVALPSSARAQLFFTVQDAANSAPHYLVRDVDLASGLDDVGMEQVAQIVYLSTLALWAGEVESSKSEVEQKLASVAAPQPQPTLPQASAPQETEAQPASARPQAHFGVEYAVRYEGQEGIAHGPGLLGVLLWSHGASVIGAAAHADFIVPHRPARAGVTISVIGGTLAAGLAGARHVSQRAELNAELGLGADVVHYRTVSTQVLLDAHAGALDIRPLSYVSVGTRLEIGTTRLGLAACLAVQLLHTHYDIQSDNQSVRAITPNILQPGLNANISW